MDLVKSKKINSPPGAAHGSADERLVTEMVVPLMADSLLQRTEPRPSIPSTKAGFVSTAIRLVATVMDKHHEAGESTSSVFFGELGAVLVPDMRLWEVSGIYTSSYARLSISSIKTGYLHPVAQKKPLSVLEFKVCPN
jgi:hypothetical protein